MPDKFAERRMMNTGDTARRIALVICARNEEMFIQSTIETALRAIRPGDALFVIADNCNDHTAAIATKAGADVSIRDQASPRGKGAAISWFVQNNWNRLTEYSHMVILDADTRISPSFCEDLNRRLDGRVLAAQCFVSPEGYENSPLATLIAMSEIVEQSIFDHLRARMGWSVRLRGTGMVFKPQVLKELQLNVETEVEDIVLSLLLTEKRIHIRSFDDVVVGDPKPQKSPAASRQRARWFRGQWRALWDYRRSVITIMFGGLNGCSLLGSLFLKPRWLKILVMLLLGMVAIRLPILPVAIFSLVFVEVMLFAIGMLRSPEKHKFLKALWYLPGFILMWIKGIFLSLQKLPWLRVRPVSSDIEAVSTIKRLDSQRTFERWIRNIASQKGVK